MKPGTTPVKRKRQSGFTLDSDDEEPENSDTEEPGTPAQVTKRAKIVATPPEPLNLTTDDATAVHPVAAHPVAHPVVTTHPAPIHPVTVSVSDGVPGNATPASPEPAALDPTPVAPYLIPSTGKGPNAVSDDDFNNDHEITYAPLNEAADAVIADASDKKLSEALGEQGAVAYLQAHTGHFDVELHHAIPEDPHRLAATLGQRWSHAVGFNGAHVADISYWDGAQFHVIEAKGGGSQLGNRIQASFHRDTDGNAVMAVAQSLGLGAGPVNNLKAALFNPDKTPKTFNTGDAIPNAVKSYLPTKLYQGTMAYLTDVAHAMARSTVGDGRNLVGQNILDNGVNVHYQPVSSQVTEGSVDVHTMDIDS